MNINPYPCIPWHSYNLNESSEKMSKQNLLRLRLETPVSKDFVHKKYWSLYFIPDISR